MEILDGLDILIDISIDIFRQQACRMSVSRGRIGHPFLRYCTLVRVPNPFLAGWREG